MFSLVKSSVVQYRREEVAALCKDNIGLVLVLETRRRESGAGSDGGAGGGAVSRLVVANTHLLFNTKREELRLGQAALLLAEVEAMSWLSDTQVRSLNVGRTELRRKKSASYYWLIKTIWCSPALGCLEKDTETILIFSNDPSPEAPLYPGW